MVWVGTGENNSQRSVGYGDGLYKSLDGGKSFKRVGLENSEHIGKILIDPRDSDVVYVAAQGPLWAAGGDRGLYKTTDGGRTWTSVLNISENTGVTDVLCDPRDPDTLYARRLPAAAACVDIDRRRPRVGDCTSRPTPARTGERSPAGYPGGDLGRIGLAVSPIKPDVVYAFVEAGEGQSGFFKSTDRGETWSKQSDYVSSERSVLPGDCRRSSRV